MKLSDFDYTLPEELIAQHPLADRDAARLLVVDRFRETLSHDIFRNITRYLPPKSLLVINNSKVIPARLLGKKVRTGGEVEVFLLKKIDANHFEAMLKPLKKIQEGERMEFPGGLSCVLVDRAKRIVRFDLPDVLAKLEQSGHIPLPPYIKRPDEARDRIDYQTVYAKAPGSVASPTAGLHFTEPLMKDLKTAGHTFAEVTLHVNYGTFKPVECDEITQHPMHSEEYEVPSESERTVKDAQMASRNIVAVGTTGCRTLEAYARSGKAQGSTNIFLYPGVKFLLTDHLITNFHLPKSTLFMLVCAFAGTELTHKAYAEAIREKYRFYSYGDAMLIL